jgi:hypothetical protein
MIDKILTEWRYRLPKGYPTRDVDYEVLADVLSEMTTLNSNKIQQIVETAKTGISTNVSESTLITERSAGYDSAIRSRLKLKSDQEIPRVSGRYPLRPGHINLNSADAEIFNILWPETLNSAIIGKGEVALYWLYQYQKPEINTMDTRGDDQPDLVIGSDAAEVKSYPSHNARIGLGRIQKFKDTRTLISIVFGIHTLANTFSEKKSNRVYSELAFSGKELAESFETFIKLDQLDGKQQLIESFPIFKQLFNQIQLVKRELNLDEYDAKSAAFALLVRLLKEKLNVKPGDDGYIINTLSKNPADIYAYRIDFESLDQDMVLSNVVVNGGSIEANYKNLFGR